MGRHRRSPRKFDEQKMLVRGAEDASERDFGRRKRIEDAISFQPSLSDPILCSGRRVSLMHMGCQ